MKFRVKILALLLLIAALFGGKVTHAADYGAGGRDYLISQISAYTDSTDANYYRYTGVFYYWSYSGHANRATHYEGGPGRWDDAKPSPTSTWLYNPVDVDQRAYLGEPASEFGWTPVDTWWNGALRATPSGISGVPSVRYVRPAATSYRRVKTTPVAAGLGHYSVPYASGKELWIRQGVASTLRLDAYQNKAGTDTSMVFDDYVNQSSIMLNNGAGVDARASLYRDGSHDYWKKSSQLAISKSGYSISGVHVYATFAVVGNVNGTEYNINFHAGSANGKVHGYIDTGYDLNVDGTNPSGSYTSFEGNWKNSTWSTTFTPSDTGSGVQAWWYTTYKNGVALESGQVNGATAKTFSFSDTGKYSIQTHVFDNVGNNAYVHSGEFLVDKVAPTLTTTSSNTAWTNEGLRINFSASDALSGLKSVVQTSPLLGGNIKDLGFVPVESNGVYTFRAEDNAGNQTSSSVNVNNIDRTKPTLVSANILGHLHADGVWRWFKPTDLITIDQTMTDTGSGLMNIYAQVTDNALFMKRIGINNGGGASWVDAMGTSTPTFQVPNASIIATSGHQRTARFTFKLPNEGKYSYFAQTLDQAWNWAGTTEAQGLGTNLGIGIDGTAPTPVTINLDPNTVGWNRNNVTVWFKEGTDSGSGIRVNEYKINGGAWTTYTAPFVLSADGTHTVYARSIDFVGNISAESSKVVQLDKTNPNGVSNSLTGETYKNGNDYWTKGGTQFIYTNTGHDATSKIQQQYVRLTGSTGGVDVKSQHEWSNVPDHLHNFEVHPSISVVSVTRGSYTGGNATLTWRILPTASENDYTVWYYLYDYAINQYGYTDTGYRIRVDSTAPTPVTITSSKDNWSNEDVVVTLSGSTDARSGFNRYEYKIGSGAWITYSAPFTISSIGTTTVTARSIDNVGNISSESVKNVYIDKLAPNVTASSMDYSWGGVSRQISLTYTDATSGIATRQYKVTTSTAVPSSWDTYNGAIDLVAHGQHYIHYRAVDNTGNELVGYFGPYRIDTVNPNGSFSPNSRVWTNSNVGVMFTPSDSASGVGSWRYRSNLNGGVYGAWSAVYTTPQNIILSNQGTHRIEAEVTDNVGNVAFIPSGHYQIDKTLPMVSASPSSAVWRNSGVAVALSYSDGGGSGLSVRQYALSSSSTIVPTSWTNYTVPINIDTTGVWYIWYRVTDVAGNERIDKVGTYNIDLVNPTISASIGNSSWGNSGVDVTLNYADAGGSGVKARRYAWSTSTSIPSVWLNYGGEVTQSAQGVWYLHAQTEDNAGNITTTRFGPYRIDKTNPNGGFSPNSSIWRNTEITPVFTPTDTGGSNVRDWRYRTSIDGGSTYGGWSDVKTGALGIILSTQGNWVIQAEVTDIAGNTVIKTSGVYSIDLSNPSGLFSPDGAVWRNTGLNVAFTPSDTGGSNVANWKWSLSSNNGSTYGAETTVNGGSAGVIAVPNTEGLWRIRVVVTDNAGNVETLVSNVYQIDKTLPLGLFTPNDHTWTNTSVVTSFNPSDLGGSGVKSWRYRTAQDGINFGAWSTVINGDTASDIILSGQGTWRVEAEITDIGGNINKVASGLFNVDTTLPNGVFSPNGAAWRNSGITVSFNPSDTGGSGVKEWRYRTSSNNGSTYGTWSAMIVGDTTSDIEIPDTEGLWRIQVEVYDIAGSMRTLTSNVYNLDKSLPSGLFTPNNRVWGWAGLNVVFNPSDTGGSGVQAWRYQISDDNGATYGVWSDIINGDTNGTINIPGTTGLWVVKVEVRDIAGNIRAFTSGIYYVDNTKPTGIFSPNSMSWNRYNINVMFNPSDGSGSGVQRWRYRTAQNGSAATPSYGSWSSYIIGDTTSDISLSTQGEWRIQVEVTDNVGNMEVYTSGVYQIDKTDPNVAFSPNSVPWRNNLINITISPTDYSGIGTSGISYFRFRLSSDRGATYGSYNTVYAGSSIAVPISTQGEWVIDVDVFDRAGNTINSRSGVYLIDTTQPNGAYSVFSRDWDNTNVTTRFTPSDNIGIGGSGVNRYYWVHKRNGVQMASGTVTGGGFRDFTFTEDGVHTLEILVTDNAGNARQVNSGEFRIDKTQAEGSVGIVYNETSSVITLTPSGIKDSVINSPISYISGLNRWVTTITAKNTAGTVVGTPRVDTTSNYTTPIDVNVHTQFAGQADKVEIRSVVYDNAGNAYEIVNDAFDVYYLKASINRALANVVDNAALSPSGSVKTRGGELLKVKIEAYGNPDRVEVEGKGIGDNVGIDLNNFKYVINNNHATITNSSRSHVLYSDTIDNAKDVFVDVYQKPGDYVITISAYKGAGLIQRREIVYTVEIGDESTITELRTRLFFKVPVR